MSDRSTDRYSTGKAVHPDGRAGGLILVIRRSGTAPVRDVHPAVRADGLAALGDLGDRLLRDGARVRVPDEEVRLRPGAPGVASGVAIQARLTRHRGARRGTRICNRRRLKGRLRKRRRRCVGALRGGIGPGCWRRGRSARRNEDAQHAEPSRVHPEIIEPCRTWWLRHRNQWFCCCCRCIHGAGQIARDRARSNGVDDLLSGCSLGAAAPRSSDRSDGSHRRHHALRVDGEEHHERRLRLCAGSLVSTNSSGGDRHEVKTTLLVEASRCSNVASTTLREGRRAGSRRANAPIG